MQISARHVKKSWGKDCMSWFLLGSPDLLSTYILKGSPTYSPIPTCKRPSMVWAIERDIRWGSYRAARVSQSWPVSKEGRWEIWRNSYMNRKRYPHGVGWALSSELNFAKQSTSRRSRRKHGECKQDEGKVVKWQNQQEIARKSMDHDRSMS